MPEGDTDSELVFAFLMSRLRSRGPKRSPIITHMVLARAVKDLARVAPSGSVTFVLSDGSALYAYRQGPPLFLLERRSPDGLESIIVASEPITLGEVWAPVPERNLLTAWRRPSLGWAMMLEAQQGSGSAPRREAIDVAEATEWSGGRGDGA